LIRLCNILPSLKKYVMEPNVFMGYPMWGIASVLNSFGHEHYPYDNPYQNNLAHGVYNVMQ
jgi:hypothetical protein